MKDSVDLLMKLKEEKDLEFMKLHYEEALYYCRETSNTASVKIGIKRKRKTDSTDPPRIEVKKGRPKKIMNLNDVV